MLLGTAWLPGTRPTQTAARTRAQHEPPCSRTFVALVRATAARPITTYKGWVRGEELSPGTSRWIRGTQVVAPETCAACPHYDAWQASFPHLHIDPSSPLRHETSDHHKRSAGPPHLFDSGTVSQVATFNSRLLAMRLPGQPPASPRQLGVFPELCKAGFRRRRRPRFRQNSVAAHGRDTPMWCAGFG